MKRPFFTSHLGTGAGGKWRLAFNAPTTAADFVSAEEFSHLGDSFSLKDVQCPEDERYV